MSEEPGISLTVNRAAVGESNMAFKVIQVQTAGDTGTPVEGEMAFGELLRGKTIRHAGMWSRVNFKGINEIHIKFTDGSEVNIVHTTGDAEFKFWPGRKDARR
jgi:hypothetical protein